MLVKMILVNHRVFHIENNLYNLVLKKASDIGWGQTHKVAKQKVMLKLRLGFYMFEDFLRFRFLSCFDKMILLIKISTK